jgi:hypothetical protein
MKLVAYPLAALLAAFGLVFVVSGAQGQPYQIAVGVILFAAAGALIWLALQQPKPSVTTIVQKIDLSGDVNLQDLTCRACGGTLGKESITVKAGAVLVNCQYCGATYQIEEQPKW